MAEEMARSKTKIGIEARVGLMHKGQTREMIREATDLSSLRVANKIVNQTEALNSPTITRVNVLSIKATRGAIIRTTGDTRTTIEANSRCQIVWCPAV
jgi:hypothetical protein